MRHKPFSILAALAILVTAGGVAEARISAAKFSRLLRASELIVRGKVADVQLDSVDRGHVVIEVVEVLRGSSPGATIQIDYSGEVHDIVMKGVGDEYLLFLASRDGKWTGALYGASYWALTAHADPAVGLVAPDGYPRARIVFDGKYRKLVRRGDKAVALSEIARAIEATTPPDAAALKARFETARGSKLAVACWLKPIQDLVYRNPCELEADFDGDHQADLALMVEEKAGKRRKGVVVITAAGVIAVAGAGVRAGSGGNDFDWMDAWKIEPGSERRNKADALIVAKAESAAGLLVLAGRRLRWQQHGD